MLFRSGPQVATEEGEHDRLIGLYDLQADVEEWADDEGVEHRHHNDGDHQRRGGEEGEGEDHRCDTEDDGK